MGKGNYGKGSITKRADGTWIGQISLGADSSGRRQRRTVSGTTKKDVLEKLRELPAEDQGEAEQVASPSPEAPVTVGAYLRLWLDEVARPSVRTKTYRAYEGIIRNHVAPRLGDLPLTSLSPLALQSAYAHMDRSGVSLHTKSMCHRVLNKAFKHAVALELLRQNPSSVVAVKQPGIKRVQALSPEEVKRLLAAAKGDRLYALYVTAIGTGMRFGELLALQWPNVNLEAGTISVKYTLVYLDADYQLGEPKSKSGKRLVTMPSFVVEALVEHRQQMIEKGLDVPWVFCNRKGGPLRDANVARKSFKPLLKKAGLPDIRFHDLRHTAATLLLGKGVHPKIVQERLGHSSITLTLDTYSHVMPSMQREAASKLDELFGA